MDDKFEEWAKSSRHPCLQQHADLLAELGASWDSFAQRSSRDLDSVVEDLVRGGIPLLAARDIVSLASEAAKQSVAPLSVFWDLENMPLPAASRGRDVVARLKSILAPHGNLAQFRAYASIGLGHVQEQKRSELQLSGCHLVDCPHLGRKEVADKMIIVDAMKFAFENPDGATLCFVTGDVDYAYLLAVLRERPMIKTLVISRGTLQSMLHVNCDIKMRWETDILQLRPPSMQSQPSTPVRRNAATSPLPQTSLEGGQDQAINGDEEPGGTLPFGEQPRTPTKDITPMLPTVGQNAESVFSPSRGHGFICTDDDSVSSFEALTVDECWTDDAELLRRTLRAVALASPAGFGSSGCATRAEVDKALRYSNPARFPDRNVTRDFLEQAIDARIVLETKDRRDGQRLLSLPPDDDDNAAFRPSISLLEQQPQDKLIDSMTKRALEMSSNFPYILFFPWKNRSSIETPFPKDKAFLQSSRKYMILMYRTLTDCQRTVAEHSWLRSGILVDWRRVEPLRKERVQCKGCRRVQSKADLLIDPKTESLYCRRCFVASIPLVCMNGTTHAARKVVEMLQMMARNDDLFVRRDTIRELLKHGWPTACASAKQTNIWIGEAVDAGAVFFFKIPGDGVSCLCLSDLASEALLTSSPPDDLDTTKEEEHIVEVLQENGGAMNRTECIESLKAKFESMQSHAVRNKLFDNAEQNGRFFIARGAFSQAVGLTLEDANAALSVTRRASVEPLLEDHEGEDNSQSTKKENESLAAETEKQTGSRGSAELATDSTVSDWEDENSNVGVDEHLKSTSQAPGTTTASESKVLYNDIWDTPTWDEGGPVSAAKD